MALAARGTRVLDGDDGEQPIGDNRIAAALKARATRIHIYALVAGLAYAGWAVLVWEAAPAG